MNATYTVLGSDGLAYGPVAAEHLCEWMGEGRVNGQTMAQVKGSAKWAPLSSFPELAERLPQPAAHVARKPRSSNWWASPWVLSLIALTTGAGAVLTFDVAPTTWWTLAIVGFLSLGHVVAAQSMEPVFRKRFKVVFGILAMVASVPLVALLMEKNVDVLFRTPLTLPCLGAYIWFAVARQCPCCEAFLGTGLIASLLIKTPTVTVVCRRCGTVGCTKCCHWHTDSGQATKGVPMAYEDTMTGRKYTYCNPAYCHDGCCTHG
jgi:hypothetical protein